MKLTRKKAMFLAKEERTTSKSYAGMGLKSFARDEARHSRFFASVAKKLKK